MRPACNSHQGFYGVYATLFAKLAKQEAEAWEKRGAAKDGSDDEGAGRQPPVHPGFGMGSATAEEVCTWILDPEPSNPKH